MGDIGTGLNPSPVRGVAKMFRCPVCDASGRINTTLGFGGSVCNLCQGSCFLNREPTPCPSCDAKGGHPRYFGLSWSACLLCHSVKYLMDKPSRCPKCRATGLLKSLGGVFSRPCDLCQRQRYLRAPHSTCIKCNFTPTLIKLIRSCINCGGIGFSREPQHLCPRCSSTGTFRGHSCLLCSGTGVIHHEVAACAKCGGDGDIKRALSLIRGRLSCPTCNGQGYFQVVSSALAPIQQIKTKGKRERLEQEERGSGKGNKVPDDDGEDSDGRGGGDRWTGGGRVIGGSEPRRRVRSRLTPAREQLSLRRQTIDFSDRQPTSLPTPVATDSAANGRASVGGLNTDNSSNERGGTGEPDDELDNFGFSQPSMTGGQGLGSGTGMSGARSRYDELNAGLDSEDAMMPQRVFSPGVAVPSESKSVKGNRRRS